jgi:hypothetical protein
MWRKILDAAMAERVQFDLSRLVKEGVISALPPHLSQRPHLLLLLLLLQ